MNFRDLTDLLNEAVLGAFEEKEKAEYVSWYGASASVRGIFDEEYVAVPAGEVPVESSGPAWSMRLSDLTAEGIKPRHGDTLDVNDRTFTVREVQPDNSDWVVLLLEGE